MHKAKTDTETNFVVTVGFTTKVDHQTTSKIKGLVCKIVSHTILACCFLYWFQFFFCIFFCFRRYAYNLHKTFCSRSGYESCREFNPHMEQLQHKLQIVSPVFCQLSCNAKREVRVLFFKYSLVQWNWFSVVTECSWVTCISDVRGPISLHQAVHF